MWHDNRIGVCTQVYQISKHKLRHLIPPLCLSVCPSNPSMCTWLRLLHIEILLIWLLDREIFVLFSTHKYDSRLKNYL